jgi:uncharacterized protein (TIGR03643 family)
MTKKLVTIDAVILGEVIDMALSDHVSFTAIKDLFGLDENQVKTIMRAHLRPARYRAWRDRVQAFGDRRAFYKRDSDPSVQERIVMGGRHRRHEKIDSETEHDGEPVPLRKSMPSKRSLAKP